jgi:hypothetical protein
MNRIFAVVISFWALNLTGLCQNESINAEIEGWNAWAVYTLSTVEILTPLQKLSAVFFSHYDNRTLIVFAPSFPTAIATPLKRIFFSHADAASQAMLEKIVIETTAQPLKTVYVSHYDAITYIILKAPLIK